MKRSGLRLCHSPFDLTIRAPPTTTLFPYTTLFRSYLEVELTESAVMSNTEEAVNMMATLRGMDIRISLDDFGTGDRKSTRLNSSHPSISYAVFCLKKKT